MEGSTTGTDLLQRRALLLRVAAVLALTIIWVRLWHMQVWQKEQHRETSESKLLVKASIAAPRGLVVDREGRPLADNRATWAVAVTPDQVAEYRRNHKPEAFGRVAAELERIFGGALTADEIQRRASQGLPAESFRPRLIVDDVSEVTRCRIKELGPELAGVDVVQRLVRAYPHPLGANAFHAIGYASNLKAEQIGLLKQGYEYSDVVGQLGIEDVYEYELRGVKGKEIIDARGEPSVEKAPVPGRDLTLAMDARIQAAAEKALSRWVNASGRRGGAAVVLDCRNGQVLALASYPAFAPEWCTSQATPDERRLFAQLESQRASGLPWVNHAISGQRCPASTFKPITLATALETGAINPATRVYCSGKLKVSEEQGRVRTKNCWKKSGHGWVGVREAIGFSCNVFCYNAGRELNRLWRNDPRKREFQQIGARAFGFGRLSGIDLRQESAGFVGDKKWIFRQRQLQDDASPDWYVGHSMDMAIGQNVIEGTPLQVACATAAIANGGTLVWPLLVKEVREDGRLVPHSYPLEEPVRRGPISSLSPQTLRLVREGMRLAVSHREGTAHAAFASFTRTEVAGKTGTDEVWNNSWFTSFAPAGNPRVVVVVFIEKGGHGSESAAPAVREIYEALFAPDGRLQVRLDGQ